MHTVRTGVDAYVKNQAFNESPIVLSSSKRISDEPLAEYVVLGVLFHSKKLGVFMD